MADTPRSWAILAALQARLEEISVASGYRTNAGADVRLEPSQQGAGTRITLYSGGTVASSDINPKQRQFTLIAEAVVPCEVDDAHARVVAMAEDIEQALDAYLPMPNALPLRFHESVILDRPEGMPVMAAQLMFTTEYRR